MKTKMTMIMVAGQREVIEVSGGADVNMTDEDVLAEVTASWLHGLVCQHDTHVLRFQHYPSGELMVVLPAAVAGFSLKTQVLN